MQYWLYQNLDDGSEHVFKSADVAMQNASRVVGNWSYSTVPNVGDNGSPMYLFGRGDGNTVVMIRAFDANTILAMGHNLPI